MVRKNIYLTPVVATYRYEVMTLDRRIESYITRVQVLASTDKSYQVRLVEPIRAHWAGDVLWVMKKNISIEQPFCNNKKVCQNVKKKILSNQFPFTEYPTVDTSNEWWQD